MAIGTPSINMHEKKEKIELSANQHPIVHIIEIAVAI
jgi:hypothetical protein